MKFKNIRYIFIGFVVVIVIFAIVQVASNNKKNQNNKTEETKEIVYQDNIRFGVSNLDTTNPLKTKNKQMLDIYQLVYEPLISLDANYKVSLCLATEYAKTSATTYIVKIDNSIKWSDGTSVTAYDVKYTVDVLKSIDSIYSENVKNIASVEAIDNSTVKFNLTEETYYFEYNLIFPIMSQSYYKNEDLISSSKIPIGTGMYKVSLISDSQIVLEKNENYRNKDQMNKNIKTIYINIFHEVGEVYNAFKIGNIDVMLTSSLLYEDYIGTIGYYVKEFKGREYDYLSFNCNDYLMSQKGVRQAINYAIDRDNIVSTVFNNKCYPSTYVLDYGSFLYNNVSSGSNLEKAKEILRNDGWNYTNNRWRKNGNVISFNLSVNSSNPKRCEAAKNIKEQLEEIGIPVYIHELSDGQYQYCLKNKNYQTLLTGVYNSYSPELTYFYGQGNIANYNNEEVARLIKDVKNITDLKLLEEKYKSIISITKEDCPYASLYRNKEFLLINQNVAGSFNPNCYGVFRNFETWNRE